MVREEPKKEVKGVSQRISNVIECLKSTSKGVRKAFCSQIYEALAGI